MKRNPFQIVIELTQPGFYHRTSHNIFDYINKIPVTNSKQSNLTTTKEFIDEMMADYPQLTSKVSQRKINKVIKQTTQTQKGKDDSSYSDEELISFVERVNQK